MDAEEDKADEKMGIKEIHDRIVDGDINSLKRLLQNEKPGESLCFKGISALKRSFFSKQGEITALLLHFGTTFKDDSDESGINVDQEYIDWVNMLWYFFQKNYKSPVDKLTTFSYLHTDKAKITVGKECYECCRHRIKSKDKFLKNILHSAAISDLYLEDVLHFCVEHFEKEEIKETFFSTKEDGLNVLHRTTLHGSSETLIKNMNLIREVIGDVEWFKQLIKCPGKASTNIFHIAAMRDWYLEDLLRFCDAHLEREEIKDMLLSSNEDWYSIVYFLVEKNSPGKSMSNLEHIKEILGNECFKQFLKNESTCCDNIFIEAAPKDTLLDDFLHICEAHLETDEIEEMLFSTNKPGLNVMHCIVISSSPDILIKNMNLIRKTIRNYESFKELLKSEGIHCLNILHLAAGRDIYLEDLLRFCDAHLKREEIKEMLLSSSKDHDNVAYYLFSKNSLEKLLPNLYILKEILGDGECFKKLLKTKGRDSRNIFHLAFTKDGRNWELDDLMQFCDAHLEKDEIKDMIFRVEEVGVNVLHSIVLIDSTEALIKDMNLIREISGEDEWFKKLLKSQGKTSINIFHAAALRDMQLEDLVKYCNTHLEREEIMKMLLTSDKVGHNIMHYLIMSKSSKNLIKNMILIKKILDNDILFKKMIKAKKSDCMNILYSAAKMGMHFDDLLRFCSQHLEKDELKNMLCHKSGADIIPYIILNDCSEKSIKSLNLIKDIIRDEKWFKDLLKLQRTGFGNVFTVASVKDRYLDDLLRFCDVHLEKDEIKNMIISTEEFKVNILHSICMSNSLETLIKNLNLIKEISGDDEWFNKLLKSQGRVNIFQIAVVNEMHLEYLLRFCNIHLRKEEIVEMLVSSNENSCSVMHYLIRRGSSENLMKLLILVKEILDDDELLKKLLYTQERDCRNLLQWAAKRGMHLDDLLRFCGQLLKKDELKSMLWDRNIIGANIMHHLIQNKTNKICLKTMNLIKEILEDEEWFKELLKSKGSNSMNIFHLTVRQNIDLDELLRFCDANLEKEELKEMLLSLDNESNNLMHSLFHRRSSHVIIRNLSVIEETVADDEWFKQLLKSKLRDSWNMFHLAGVTNLYIGGLLQFCEAHLEICEIKEMLFDNDTSDLTAMQHLFWKKTSKTVIRNINIIKEKFGNDTLFLQFFSAKRGIIIACLDPHSFNIVIT